VTYKETVEYGEVMMFMGRPVVLNNVMNSTDAAAANTIDILYGDVSLGVDFGDRMSLEIDISDQVYWTSNGIGVKGTVRHDVNVHDIGSTSRVGPIVALYQS
jgi:HK97 family phage major capsid protein